METKEHQRLREAQEQAEAKYGMEVVQRVQNEFETKTWQVFLLFRYQELKAPEIAPLFGLSNASVHQAVSRVRRKLEAESKRESG